MTPPPPSREATPAEERMKGTLERIISLADEVQDYANMMLDDIEAGIALNELARERRRCEMQEERIEALVKALEEIKTLSTRHLNHLPSGPCVVHTEAWSVAQAALNAAKALQGQDGAK
jgi:hypothetical protein